MTKLLRAVSFVAKLALLLPALGLVSALAWLSEKPKRALLAIAVLALSLGAFAPHGCWPGHGPVKVATFNIRRFGVEPTDMKMLADTVADVGADILAVQEIQSVAKLDALAKKLSGPGRSYTHALASCGGKSEMLVGFLYDQRRVRLERTREFAELDPDSNGSCTEGDRAGLVGEFDVRGRRVSLLVVHLSAGGTADKAEKRRAQWQRVATIVERLKKEGATSVAVVGDTNSTGYLDNRHGERDFIGRLLSARRLELPTGALACSEYWVPSGATMQPALLDHVIATPGLVAPGSATLHGYCAALRCQPHDHGEAPEAFVHVSDHCPVSFQIAP